MEKFCNLSFDKSLQHTDATDARMKRDHSDLRKIEEFLNQHHPFSDTGPIMSIATGVTGDETINCCDAFEVGVRAMNKMDKANFKEVKLSKKDKVVPLLAVHSKIKIHEDIIPIDPLLLFQRICVSKRSDEELKNYLQFELAPYPLPLFDDAGMRKTKKYSFFDLFSPLSINLRDDDQYMFIIDGGMLLHHVKWQLEQKFESICGTYVRYLKNNYGNNVVVVFDGYDEDRTKSIERNRRSMKNASVDFIFEKDMSLKIAQDKFLANSHNKSRLIAMLREMLTENNILSHQAESDADRLIVTTAIDIVGEDVVVVAEDIDVLILLTALTPDSKEIHYLKPAKGKIEQKVFSSKGLKKSLPNCQQHILFLHALTGCDTTSAFHNKGKNAFANAFEKRADLQTHAEMFKADNQELTRLLKAGVPCILALYGAPKTKESLNEFRYECFIKATTKNTRAAQLAALPPTNDASSEHLKRVYLQVQLWLGNNISPEEWGWKYDRKLLMPVRMNQQPAPGNILKIIFCNCKKGCGSACGCRKSGLHCTEVCGVCSGSSCQNSEPFVQIGDLDAEDEIDDDSYE